MRFIQLMEASRYSISARSTPGGDVRNRVAQEPMGPLGVARIEVKLRRGEHVAAAPGQVGAGVMPLASSTSSAAASGAPRARACVQPLEGGRHFRRARVPSARWRACSSGSSRRGQRVWINRRSVARVENRRSMRTVDG